MEKIKVEKKMTDINIGDNQEKKNDVNVKQKQLGGVRTMPFILANEVCDRFAGVGFHANMMTYLTQVLNLPLVKASNTISNFGGTSSFTPIIGAFVADSFLGRYWTIIIGSIIYVLGMVTITISAVLPHLRPPPCPTQENCQEASNTQLWVLYIALLLTSLGTGGIRPCVVTFAADQFDMTKSKTESRSWNFFNWYYFCMAVASLLALTVVVYIQDKIGWGWGLGIPTIAMGLSLVAFILGAPLYKKIKPGGSPFVRVTQVIVAAVRKRKVVKPAESSAFIGFRHERVKTTKSLEVSNSPQSRRTKNHHQNAAYLGSSHTTSSLTIPSQLFHPPTSSEHGPTLITVFSNPACHNVHFHHLNHPNRPASIRTSLRPIFPHFHKKPYRHNVSATNGDWVFDQHSRDNRFGCNRDQAKRRGCRPRLTLVIPISVFWLVPQYCLHGLAEVFMSVGHLEFLYDQSPESMRSTSIALYWIAIAIGNYVSTLMVSLVHKYTGEARNWLPDRNLNRGKLENYYWLVTGVQVVNLIYYVICAWFYKYKPIEEISENIDVDVESADNRKPLLGDGEDCREVEMVRN
ncbi:hypothetical protein DH2020_039069 [Rehmannia glutinosa]|uniref:Uncharacterized protein n=1 Tax=Rehmannia glutinosa TaxID=99300 RepID=A0ABR0UZ09_REHGL